MKVLLTEAQIITLKRNSMELGEMASNSRKGDNPKKKYQHIPHYHMTI